MIFIYNKIKLFLNDQKILYFFINKFIIYNKYINFLIKKGIK